MADTSFVSQITTIAAAWLNQANKLVFWGRRPNVATTTGSANAQILTLETGSLYSAGTEADGDEFVFLAGYTNAAAMTLQVLQPSGTNVARAVQLNGVALTGGEVIAGQPYRVTRKSTTWQLTSLAGTAFGTSLLQVATAAALRTLAGAAASGANSDITSLALVLQFSGRVTLVTGTPVMTTDQTAKTTVYFTPYNGNQIPIYDGTNMVQTTFTDLSQATTDSTKSPAAVTTNSNYDIFVWNDAGTLRATRGPAWSSDTARGTGAGTTELEMVKGVYLNKVAITNGPAANRGTYVGTIRSNGSSQIDWKLGSAASGGGEALLGVWNMYNRVDTVAQSEDSVASYTYTSTTIRSMNNSTTNRISFVVGLAEDAVRAERSQFVENSASGDCPRIGISLDSTSTFTESAAWSNIQATGQGVPVALFNRAGLLGFHYLQAVEKCSSAVAACTFYGTANNARALFNFKARM